MTNQTTTTEPGDEITTIDEANGAIQNKLVLRVQPPAPGATEYYAPSGGEWYRAKSLKANGQGTFQKYDIDGVRRIVKTRGGSKRATVTACTIEDSPFGDGTQ